jgi:hypothetical protein
MGSTDRSWYVHFFAWRDLAIYLVDLTEVVIVLNSDEAVKAFSRGGNVTVGGEL